MNALENYKSNVDLVDTYGIKNDLVGRNMLCRLRHIQVINRRKEGVEERKEIRRPLAAAVLGVNNTGIAQYSEVPVAPEATSTWTNIDEQKLFIDTKPNSYIIISKPGAGAYSLGEEMAKKLKCVHICPRNVIIDEIEQRGPTGECVDFNMTHFRECKINSIMSIIKQKLHSPAVQYRGYILSGLPLVSCTRTEFSFFKKMYPEDAVDIVKNFLNDFILNLKKKKKVPKSGTTSTTSVSSGPEEVMPEEHQEEEEEVVPEGEEEEDTVVELPKYVLEPCKNVIFPGKNYYDSKKLQLMQQINHLFKLDFKPDIFIYITCSDEDLVGKRHCKYLNFMNNMLLINPHIQPQQNEIRWPEKYSLRDFHIQHDANDVNFKYAVRHPLNFTKHSTVQLCNYRNNVLPFWQKKINDINPKYIIKVDGRSSVQEMLHHICERLDMLPVVKPVLIPEPVTFDEPIEDLDEFWKIVESTKIIQNSEIIFNRFASPWYNRCPVELKKRHCVRGKSKYALALFNHVFLLSSLENFTAFYKNPKPYLDYYMMEPTCRIIVMGTKSSGKSMIAECLSWLFDCNIISYDTIYNNEKQKKYEVKSKVILEEIMENIEEARYNKWQNAENERLSSLEMWQNSALASLKKYTFLLGDYLKMLKEDGNTQTERLTKIDKSLNNVKKNLTFLPFLEDLAQCKNALSGKNITQYAPANLTIILEKPNVPILGDPDVNEAILEYIEANDLQKEMDPTPEDVMNIFLEILRSLDSESMEAYSCYGKFVIDGFPPDNEHWDYLTESNLLPDYTIAIIENREINDDLIQHYMQLQNTFKHHKERFILANDPLINIKVELLRGLGQTDLTESHNMNKHVQKILHDSINSTISNLGIPEEDIEQYQNEQIISFSQANDKFREDWEAIKLKLEDNFKSFIEVEIDVKSDTEVLEDVLLQLRKCYYVTCELYESEENGAPEESEEDVPKDFLIYNDPRFLCETGIFCPISFFEQGVLWEGKSEFSVKLLNKMHYFAKEECLELFRKDPTKYQSYNMPFKKIPPWRICVTGCVGSGKTKVSRFVAKELGLIHVDFEDAVNKFILPKHFKKVGRKYENIFLDIPVDEEGVVEFQMAEDNENFISDITYNETELRRMIYNYFERGTPMLSVLIQKILKKLWFDEPFASTGFILDGFPRNSNDIEDMVACVAVPDLILELESSSDVALERVVPEMFKTWKTQQKEAKAKAQRLFDSQKQKWSEFITKEVVVKVVIDDILNDVMSVVEVEPPAVASNMSTMIDADPSGSADVNANVYNTYMETIEQNPAPVDESEWEKAEEARERLEGRIEAIYESDDENIQAFKDVLLEQKIKCESVDATARRVPVPDERFDYLVEYHKPASKVPAFLNVVDIAGLVRGAAEGQGLGNAFLSHIKACDAIFNLCRAFDDEDVIHVDGDVNPVRDLETIGEELRLKDAEQLLQHIDKLDRVVNRGGDKKLKPEYDTLAKVKTVLTEEKKHIRFSDWSAADIEVLNKYLFLTSKPALYLVNLSEKDYIRKKNKWLPKLKEWIDKNDPGAPLIPFSGVLESKLMDMDPEEKKAFLKEHGITSALDKIIVQGYKALQLEYFFTAGPDEVKAWTIQKGTKAPQAAGRIHTDFEKGFIMAEVMHYKDFKEEGTEAACKAAGKYRQQGRNYVVEDGDIIFFKFNAGAGLKDAKKK